MEIDVMAISWMERAILIGECKRSTDAVDRQTVLDLLERTIPLTLADPPEGGTDWHVYLALFARMGATPAARTALMVAGGILVNLTMLFYDLADLPTARVLRIARPSRCLPVWCNPC